MIRVTIGNNMGRKDFNFDPQTTLRDALEQTAQITGVDYTRGMMSLDGSTVGGADLDKTFYELGYTGEPKHDKCYLLNVVKADNA